MDGLLYPISLIILAIFIYNMMQYNNSLLALIALVIGIYIVYSHETGYTATDFRHEMVESLDEGTGNYKKETDIETPNTQ